MQPWSPEAASPPAPTWTPAPAPPPAPMHPVPQPAQAPVFQHAQAPFAPHGNGVQTDQRPINAVAVTIAWVSTVLTLGYMLPWAIAASRGKANHGAIAVINLLLGWTFVGWIVALVMACLSHQVVGPGSTVIVAQQFTGAAPASSMVPAGWYPSPDQHGHQYWDGQSWTGHQAP